MKSSASWVGRSDSPSASVPWTIHKQERLSSPRAWPSFSRWHSRRFPCTRSGDAGMGLVSDLSSLCTLHWWHCAFCMMLCRLITATHNQALDIAIWIVIHDSNVLVCVPLIGIALIASSLTCGQRVRFDHKILAQKKRTCSTRTTASTGPVFVCKNFGYSDFCRLSPHTPQHQPSSPHACPPEPTTQPQWSPS